MVEKFEKHSGVGFKNRILCCTHQNLFSKFLMSIIWLLIFYFLFFLKFLKLLNCFVCNFFGLGSFSPFYFLFASESPFDAAYVSDDLGEHTFEDSNDWDKFGSYFGLGGGRRMAIQLLEQLDEIELQ